MSREWETGRLARIAGKPRSANPYQSSVRRRRWLSGWMEQDAKQAPEAH